MPLTRSFNETVRARAQADPEFRQALLREAIECILNGELAVGRSVLRDCVNATLGFQELEKRTHIPAKSLMRMLSPKGSPSAENLFTILAVLQETERVRFSVRIVAPTAQGEHMAFNRQAEGSAGNLSKL